MSNPKAMQLATQIIGLVDDMIENNRDENKVYDKIVGLIEAHDGAVTTEPDESKLPHLSDLQGLIKIQRLCQELNRSTDVDGAKELQDAIDQVEDEDDLFEIGEVRDSHNPSLRVDLVFDDWREKGRSIYSTAQGNDLSMGDFHSGTTFNGVIECDDQLTLDELHSAMREGFTPVFWLSLP